MKGSDSQTPGRSSPWVGDLGVGSHPDAEEDGIRLVDDRPQLGSADVRAEPELDADSPRRGRFVRQRLTHLPVGRDRVPDEASRLFTLVEDRDGVAERGQLAGADEPGGAGADNRNPSPVPRGGLSDRGAVRERIVRRVALERRDRDRLATDLGQHAGALAQHLGRTNARARRTEQVLGEDRVGRRPGVVVCDRTHEARHVDARGAGDHARREGVRAAALETAICFEEGVVTRERRMQLFEDRLRRGNAHHASTFAPSGLPRHPRGG